MCSNAGFAHFAHFHIRRALCPERGRSKLIPDRYMFLVCSLKRGALGAHDDGYVLTWDLPGAYLVPPWCILAPLDLVPGPALDP